MLIANKKTLTGNRFSAKIRIIMAEMSKNNAKQNKIIQRGKINPRRKIFFCQVAQTISMHTLRMNADFWISRQKISMQVEVLNLFSGCLCLDYLLLTSDKPADI